MKNLFALNSREDLIHISEVNKNIKEKYACLNCGNELIAKKGKQKAHHFAHKTILNCNFETYLHKLGKLTFIKTYENCLKNNIPFYVEYSTKHICTSCETDGFLNRTCDLDEKIGQFDLTKTFDIVNSEKYFDGYVADILLESSKETITDKIFIEIVVTHSCEHEKIESGNRIIEIKLSEENDIKYLNEHILKLDNENVIFYNFKNKIVDEKRAIHKCNKDVDIFSVLNNKKAIKRKEKVKRINSILKNKNYVYNKIRPLEYGSEDYGGEDYINFVEEASHLGVDVRNCFACRFIAFNKNYWSDIPYFCKRHRTGIGNTNFGVECDKFWRIEKPDHNHVVTNYED